MPTCACHSTSLPRGKESTSAVQKGGIVGVTVCRILWSGYVVVVCSVERGAVLEYRNFSSQRSRGSESESESSEWESWVGRSWMCFQAW